MDAAVSWSLPAGIRYQSGQLYTSSCTVRHDTNTAPGLKLCAGFSMQLEGLKNVVFDNFERWIFRLNWNRNRVVTERDGASTSLHFLHSTLPYYGLVLNTFSFGCYISHHIQVVTFPDVPLTNTDALMLDLLMAGCCGQTNSVVPSSFSYFFNKAHIFHCFSEVSNLFLTYLVMKI